MSSREDVRVPIEDLISERTRAGPTQKFLLGNERTSMAGIGRSTRIPAAAQGHRPGGNSRGPIRVSRSSSSEIARIEVDVLALEATELRVVAQMSRGIDPGRAHPLFKIRSARSSAALPTSRTAR